MVVVISLLVVILTISILILWGVLRLLRPPERVSSIDMTSVIIPKPTFSRLKGTSAMAIDPITVDLAHDVVYAATPKAGGNPVPATLSWDSDNVAVLELIPSPDTLGCLAVTKAEGTATVTVSSGTVSNSQVVTVVAAPPPPVDAIDLVATVVPKE